MPIPLEGSSVGDVPVLIAQKYWRRVVDRRWLLVPMLMLVAGCAKRVDGTSFATTADSINAMSDGMSQEEKVQFKKDVDTIVFSLPPLRAPEHLNGMTQAQIAKEAHVIRLKSQIKEAQDRIGLLNESAKQFAAENAVRDDASEQLAKVAVTFQQASGGGGLEQPSVGCLMLVKNGSRHTLSRLWWRSGNVAGDTMLVPDLKPGESRTLDSCGDGGFLVESVASVSAQAERAELPGPGADLEPWADPSDRQRTVDPDKELPEQQARLSRLQDELEATE